MKVVDVFPFNDECDLLEIRLNTLDELVDKFVITECRETHSGMPKDLTFTRNQTRFSKFQDKIHYQIIDGFPPGLSGFERDWYQRNQVKEILATICDENDIVIYGDVDEIPNPSTLKVAIGLVSSGTPIVHLAQQVYYYFLNLRETSGRLISYAGEYRNARDKKWLGTVVTNWRFMLDKSVVSLRDPQWKAIGHRLANGGWHFSFVSGDQTKDVFTRVMEKMQHSAHGELKGDKVIKKLRQRLARNKDLLGRRGVRFVRDKDLSGLPSYVVENQNKFQGLLLK